MFDFLKFEGLFAQTIYKIFNMIVISAMWAIFCIPVFTAGASTTALYYTVQKNFKNDRGNSWQCFWNCFKSNFRQSTIINLIFMAVAFVFLTDYNIIDNLLENGKSVPDIRSFFIIVIVLMCIYAFWVFAYIARFVSTIKGALKNALMLGIYHFPMSIAIAVIGAGAIILIYLLWPLVFIIPVVSVWLMSFFVEKVFRKHMSEEDRRQEDDINIYFTRE